MASGNSANDVIKKFMASLDKTTKQGTAALDEAVKACSSFSTIQGVIDQLISDCKSSSSASDFLKNYCGIILNNSDTGAITGSDAGGSKIKTAESIVPESGSLNTSFNKTSFTTNGVTFELADSNLTANQNYIWQALYTWWAKEALNLIKESYGYSFSDSDATVKKIIVGFSNSNNAPSTNTKAWVRHYDYNSDGKTDSLRLTFNMDAWSNFSGVNGGKAPEYIDRVVAHELTHAIMAAKVNYFSQLPRFIKEGSADLTHGVDDERGTALLYLVNNPDVLKNTLTATADSEYVYAGGYILLRYLAKQASAYIYNSTINTIVTGSADAENIANVGSYVTINALGGSDTIFNGGYYSKIDAGAGNDTIYNWAGTDSLDNIITKGENCIIDGGAGNDYIKNFCAKTTIRGGAGNDTIFNSSFQKNNKTLCKGDYAILYGDDGDDYIVTDGTESVSIYGGKGNDTINFLDDTKNNHIFYSNGDGNDIIYNISSTDTIHISGTSYSTQNSSNSKDVIITAGSGKITLQGAKGTELKIDGKIIPIITGTNNADSLYNSLSGYTINGLDGNDTIENDGKANKVTIYGGAGNDSIHLDYRYYTDTNSLSAAASYSYVDAGDGNDSIVSSASKNSTLHGGAGNDYLSSASSNSKIYGDAGNDTLFNGYINNKNGVTMDKGQYCTLEGGAGNDSIANHVSNVTIKGGAGDDTITLGSNASNDVIIYDVGDGNDIISGYKSSDTISLGGSVSYSTTTTGSDFKITTDSGSMLVKNAASMNVKIVGGKKSTPGKVINGTSGADSLYNSLSGCIIDGLGGNDTIDNRGSKATIYGGDGADTIHNHGSNVLIEGGAGNDTIWNCSGTDSAGTKATIYGGDGNDKIDNDEKNTRTYIDGGAGRDSIYNWASYSTILGGADNDSIGSSTDGIHVYIDGGAGNDTIKNYSSYAKVIGNAGNDSIYNGNENVTILGGAGNDTISNARTLNNDGVAIAAGNKSYIDAGAGNDSIVSWRTKNVTIKGGAGNDTITFGTNASNNVIIYEVNDGNDVIQGISATDTINISGATYSTQNSGSDVIITAGSGKMTVKNGKGVKFKIKGESKPSPTLTVTNDTKSPVTVGSAIKTINASTRTTAVKITGNSLANSIVGGKGKDTLIGGKGNDTLTGGSGANVFVYSNGDGNDVITDYSAQDKISITGGTYSTSISGNDVRIKVGSGSILVKNGKNKTLTINNSRAFEERWFLDNSECGMRNDELSSILDSKSNDIVINGKHNDSTNFLQKTLTTLSSNKKEK